MTTPNENSDDQLKPLFAATERDAAPADRTELESIRERSAAEFALHSRDQWSRSQPPSASPRLFPGLFFSLAATAAVVMAGFFFSRLQRPGPRPVADLTFGEVMQNLARAKSFQAELLQENETATVWGRGNAIRLELSPTRYTIYARDGVYRVDEDDNIAKPSPWLEPTAPDADPLRIWHLSSASIASDKPTSKRMIGGRDYLVFESTYPQDAEGDEARIEMLVDSVTRLPLAISTRSAYQGKPQLSSDLRFVAFNKPLDESKLKVSATLTEDGRIGKIADWQGNVALRPLTSTRWTPVCDKPILRLGDWLRTDYQGANAITVQLAPDTKLILGPGSLVEFKKPDQITLHSGFAEITPAPKSDNFSGVVKLTGPAGAVLEVAGVKMVRATDNGLLTTDQEPAWLAGYKGNAVAESMGSLVATIDGRRVPLTVGYHKVSVEIRDQIARTTIEESFVNHTDAVLEGQFHFPLPADASISGFGMWVGNRLVEADIVEKQRAREIYETILREKRDPGLLEWTGGNIFKARIYPIPASGEKRIKIVYTQVLPKKGDSYRYSYALQSDLLRQNPLRQLDLEVTVASTQELTDVTCPTHQTRNQVSEHAARVEFSAQNYTPTRDFEVVVDTSGPSGMWKPEVVFIPHQRGDDGYFLMQLQPPGDDGAWQRDVLPDGEALRLLILADTSASLDSASRKTQAEVLAALLGALAPKDAFNLGVCDVDCTWTFDKPQPADEKNITAARETLAQRRSLGWTNLDRAFESVAKQVEQGTQVIYLGDGIVTTGDMDGPAFVSRLTQLMAGKGATLHAVAVSSSYDAAVLRGMATIGGGSLRNVSGEVGPQQTAKDLLAEITRPALKNIQLEFQGLRTARVYPRVLPNVPAGTQQIVLGRYLPTGAEQSGEVIVSGVFEGKPATYRTKITVPSMPPPSDLRPPTPNPRSLTQDSSFIPRLWARLHLDELLAQGTSQEIQDEIINLSEEFHLITPYTSLLVLESDADRERFKVKRRFQMRDGERFFADTRDVAQYQLVQQQMQRAGLWRQGIREHVISSLAGLGRDRNAIERMATSIYSVGDLVVPLDKAERVSGAEGWNPGFNYYFGINRGEGVTFGGVSGAGGYARRASNWYDYQALGDEPTLVKGLMTITDGELFGVPEYEFSKSRASLVFAPTNKLMAASAEDVRVVSNGPWDGTALEGKSLGFVGDEKLYKGRININGLWDVDHDGAEMLGRLISLDAPIAGQAAYAGARLARGRRNVEVGFALGDLYEQGRETNASAPLFPIGLPPAPRPPRPTAERKSQWPEEAQKLAQSLQQSVILSKLDGGLIVEEQVDTFDPHRGRLTGRTSWLRLAAAKSWLTRHAADGYDPRIEWARKGERGAYSAVYELGLIRKPAPTDFPMQFEISRWWQANIERALGNYSVEIQRPVEGRALLVARHVVHPHREMRILIDTARNAALSMESYEHGKLVSAERVSELANVSGVWLPQRIETLDDQGHTTSVTTRKLQVVAQARFDELMQEHLSRPDSALTIKLPLPSEAAAKQKSAQGVAALEDNLVLLLDLTTRQKWSEAHEQLARCEAQAAGKSFADWMRAWLLEVSRRHEELRQLLQTEAKALAANAKPGERTLVERITSAASSHLSYEERLSLLDVLAPVYARLPEHIQGRYAWGELRQALLHSAGREEEQLTLLRELVREFPDEDYAHRILARRLIEQGDYEAGYQVLKATLSRPDANWSPRERELLYEVWADHLKGQGRWAEQGELAAEWMKHEPEDADVYERYLACLVYNRREDEADRLTAEWLAQGKGAGPLAKPVAARVIAAVESATGDNSYLQSGDLDPRYLPALVELLVAHVAGEEGERIVSEISSDSDVRRTDQYRSAAKQILDRTKAEAATLSVDQLQRLVAWCNSYAEQATDEDWKVLAAAIRPRWEAATHPAIEESLATSLLSVAAQIGTDERLALLRLRLDKADERERPGRARALFDALLEAAWSEVVESESLGLIPRLGSDETALRDQVAALYRWTDRMEEGRYEKLHEGIERPDKLTRTELEKKREELRKQARSDLAARLKAAAAAHEGQLKNWLLIERLTMQVRLEQDPPGVVEEAWELIGSLQPAGRRADADQPPTPDEQLLTALRARALTLLMHLAIRKDAPPAEAQRLITHLDAAIAAETSGIDARLAKYVLLVALDKPQLLVEQLAAWSKGDDRTQFWQRTLGYLKAELGDLDAAVALFEPLAADDVLEAADYQALAGWYQALKRDEKYAGAQLSAWKQLDEWQLRDVVRAQLSQWENTAGPSPGAIEPQSLPALQALLAKSSNPSQHVQLVRNLYEKSRDFRLIAALADAVLGQSAGSIYPFLRELRSTLAEIDREAAVDELLAHVVKVRERAQAPTDQRALDLLTMLAEQRAAEIQNQPGPHAAAAVAALKRAMQPAWSAGEARNFTQLLAGLGRISQPSLSAERLRVIESLYAAAANQPHDRLPIAHALAESLIADDQREQAIEVLEGALTEHRQTAGGKTAHAALDSLRLLGNQLLDEGHFIRAEDLYRGELARASNPQVTAEIRVALWRVHVRAISERGRTSLGQGVSLYRAAEKQLVDELRQTPDERQRYELVGRLCELYEAAHQQPDLAIAVKTDIVRFGREQLPALLDKQIDNHQEMLERFERTVRGTAGHLPALELLVVSLENEPAWLTRKGDDGWRHFAWEIGILHDEVRGKLGELEPRLLKIVLAELRRELTTQTQRRQVIYHRGSTHYWQEREDDFVRVAEEVLAERRDSLPSIQYVSNYLYRGLARHERAIEILLDAERRGPLDDDGRSTLVLWLQERQRYGESIGFLESLLKEQPSSLAYRVQLMRAYFQTKQPAALAKLLDKTDKYFRLEDRWSEEVAAQLAMSTLENGLTEQAVEYLNEAIGRREEALNNQTSGDRTLAQYYVDRAYAFAGLANTKAAVDDACSAAVIWGVAGDGLYRRRFQEGSTTSEQVHPLDVLKHVLAQSPNLDAYVAELDAEVARSSADRPIVRKSLGDVYFEQKQFDRAVTQLKQAIDLSPSDGAIHAKLIECYDALMLPRESAEQLFASVELARRDVDLWTKLAERLEKLEQPLEAERARTSLVEMLPSESEGHAKLAEIRQQQNRWDDAVEHWRHVARIRKLEPAGLLGLAAAQIHQQRRADADKTLRELETTDWPARFHDELRQKQLPKLREEFNRLPPGN